MLGVVAIRDRWYSFVLDLESICFLIILLLDVCIFLQTVFCYSFLKNINQAESKRHFHKNIYLKSHSLIKIAAMILDQQSRDKKVRLNDQDYEAVITHNTKMKCLQVTSKSNGKDIIYWGRFTIQDLDASILTLFERIDNLYNYICQNMQEIELSKSLVTIRLNFLKQTKELKLKLCPMVMCSQDENESLYNKIQQLQIDLKNEKINNNVTNKKLTYQISPTTVNLKEYDIINFNRIKHYGKIIPISVLKICAENKLQNKGIWAFQILVQQINRYNEVGSFEANIVNLQKRAESFLEIGVRNEQSERSLQKFYYKPQIEEVQNKQKVYINKNELLLITINMDYKKMMITKVFSNETISIGWNCFQKSENLWLYLSCYRLEIMTNLFLKEEKIQWESGDLNLKQQQK